MRFKWNLYGVHMNHVDTWYNIFPSHFLCTSMIWNKFSWIRGYYAKWLARFWEMFEGWERQKGVARVSNPKVVKSAFRNCPKARGTCHCFSYRCCAPSWGLKVLWNGSLLRESALHIGMEEKLNHLVDGSQLDMLSINKITLNIWHYYHYTHQP